MTTSISFPEVSRYLMKWVLISTKVNCFSEIENGSGASFSLKCNQKLFFVSLQANRGLYQLLPWQTLHGTRLAAAVVVHGAARDPARARFRHFALRLLPRQERRAIDRATANFEHSGAWNAPRNVSRTRNLIAQQKASKSLLNLTFFRGSESNAASMWFGGTGFESSRGSVAQRVARWACDLEGQGSNPVGVVVHRQLPQR